MIKLKKRVAMILLSIGIVASNVAVDYVQASAAEWVFGLWSIEEVMTAILGGLGLTLTGAIAHDNAHTWNENINKIITSMKDYVGSEIEGTNETFSIWLDNVIADAKDTGKIVIDSGSKMWQSLKKWAQEVARSPEKVYATNVTGTVAAFQTALGAPITQAEADKLDSMLKTYPNYFMATSNYTLMENDKPKYHFKYACIYAFTSGCYLTQVPSVSNGWQGYVQLDWSSVYGQSRGDIMGVSVTASGSCPAQRFGKYTVMETGDTGDTTCVRANEIDGISLTEFTIPCKQVISPPKVSDYAPDLIGQTLQGINDKVQDLIDNKTYVDNYDVVTPGQVVDDLAPDVPSSVEGDISIAVPKVLPKDDTLDDSQPIDIPFPDVIPIDKVKDISLDRDIPIDTDDRIPKKKKTQDKDDPDPDDDIPVDKPVKDMTSVGGGLKTVFPFCIPFDLIDAIKILNKKPKEPRFEYTFKIDKINFEYTFVIDFKKVEPLVIIFRYGILLLFIVSLILLTRTIIRG